MPGVVVLRPHREKPIRQRHPWLFSGAIARADAEDGGIVDVRASDGAFLARGYYNSASQIRVRILTWDEAETIDDRFWHRRLAASIARRDGLLVPPETDARRLVNAESDGLPGLIVDQYGPCVVLQALSLGVDRRKSLLAGQLAQLTGAQCVYERSDEAVRALESLGRSRGPLIGSLASSLIEIRERGRRFWVDVARGHKTGFYLDQRDNRELVRRLAHGRRTLNAFAYTGAFTVCAAAGGAADTVSVESSRPAVDLAKANLAGNGLGERGAEDTFIVGDVFGILRDMTGARRSFDLVILDPPRFARSSREVARAARGYKDINRLAFGLLAPGGILVTFSCSGPVSEELFGQIVFAAAIDAGASAQIIGRLGQAPDHPVALTFPEGRYLKGLVCRVD